MTARELVPAREGREQGTDDSHDWQVSGWMDGGLAGQTGAQ